MSIQLLDQDRLVAYSFSSYEELNLTKSMLFHAELYICIYQNKLNDYMIFILQVSNMFIMSLALADLTVGVIVMPITSAYTITGNF